MVYITLLLISSLLAFLDLSFMPYFSVFHATPFLLLPFLVLLSIKYKGYSHLFFALVFGILYDFATIGFVGRFTQIFLITIILGRLIFFRETSYETVGSFLILTTISTVLIYLSELYTLARFGFAGWQNYLIIMSVGVFLTLVFGLILRKMTYSYIEWLNKKYEESKRR